jgi:hypothetical protein
MVKYNSERQLTIEEFKTPFQTSLLADNRWVKLSKVVPWDKFAGFSTNGDVLVYDKNGSTISYLNASYSTDSKLIGNGIPKCFQLRKYGLYN